MTIITDEKCAGYSRAGHPERPGRILGTLKKLGEQTDLAISWKKPWPCEDRDMLRAHAAEVLERLGVPEDFDTDTPAYPRIAEHARASAGAALEAARVARGG